MMKQLQNMSEDEVALVAQISGRVYRARKAIREAAEAADRYLDAKEQGVLSLAAPSDKSSSASKPEDPVN
jgi:hypothetical protein